MGASSRREAILEKGSILMIKVWKDAKAKKMRRTWFSGLF